MTKKELEKKVEELEEKMKRLENPTYPVMPRLPNDPIARFDPECLHNGCGHDRPGHNVCWLSCPHCSPMC